MTTTTPIAPAALSPFDLGVRMAHAAKKAHDYAHAVKKMEEPPDFDIDDLINYLMLLIGLGLFNEQQATAIVEAARSDTDSPALLSEALSTTDHPAYDIVRVKMADAAETDDVIDTLQTILDALYLVGDIIDTVGGIIDSIADWLGL